MKKINSTKDKIKKLENKIEQKEEEIKILMKRSIDEEAELTKKAIANKIDGHEREIRKTEIDIKTKEALLIVLGNKKSREENKKKICQKKTNLKRMVELKEAALEGLELIGLTDEEIENITYNEAKEILKEQYLPKEIKPEEDQIDEKNILLTELERLETEIRTCSLNNEVMRKNTLMIKKAKLEKLIKNKNIENHLFIPEIDNNDSPSDDGASAAAESDGGDITTE